MAINVAANPLYFDSVDVTGTHDGGNNSDDCIDASFEFAKIGIRVGATVTNDVDLCSGVAKTINGSTITFRLSASDNGLSGGTDDDFDNTDTFTITNIGKNGMLRITKIVWVSDDGSARDIAIDDDFKAVDVNGKVIVGKRAEAVGQGDEWNFDPPLTVDGFVLTELDGGVLYVYRR